MIIELILAGFWSAIGWWGAGAATAGGSVLPSTAIGTGMATSVPSIVGAGTAAGVGGASAAGTGGILSSIGSVGKALPAIGQMTGALTKGMAANRGTSAELALAQGELGTSQEAENRAERGDAWKKLLNANYILKWVVQLKCDDLVIGNNDAREPLLVSSPDNLHRWICAPVAVQQEPGEAAPEPDKRSPSE